MYPFLFSNLGNIKDYETGEFWSRKEFFKEIQCRIACFKNLGIKKNDKVIIAHGNNIRFFADLFALWHLNASAVCIDNNIGISEFDNIISVCKSSFIIIKGKIPDKISKSKYKKVQFVDTMKCNQEILNLDNKNIKFDSNFESIALILFTSGTTGTPKGVVHTFRSLISKWISLENFVPLKYMNNSLCLLPTNFGHGLICNCLYPLLNGKTLLILPKFNITLLSKLNKIIDENNINYMSSVPSVWKIVLNLSKKPVKNSLQLITCGSAPLSAFLWENIQNWSSIKRVWNTYGITETGSWIAGTEGSNVVPKDGKTGRGWGTNIIISKDISNIKNDINLLDNNNRMKKNEKGYIWVQTSSLMQGYLGQKKMTNSVVCGSWFFTGDLGYLDPKGNLVLTGRVRNEINTGGIKVTPEDIDLILERNPKIIESCTFGMPDDLAGEIVATALIIKENTNLLSDDMHKWICKYISDYKAPKVWYRVKEIPKTTRGKINREEVAKYCSNITKMK